jgi:protein SCO1
MRELLLSLALLLLAAPAPAAFDPLAEAGIERLPDARLPAEAGLFDETGRPVRLGDYFGGPPLLVAAVSYDCPNLCGLTLDGLFGGLAGTGLSAGRDYRLLVVGIDPREGPVQAARLKGELGRRRDLDWAGVHFLTGPAEAVARSMGIRAGWDEEHRQFAHVSAVAVTTPDGRLSRWLMGVAFEPRTLRLGLAEAGNGKVGTLGDQVMLLCYGYDPMQGRYGWVVPRLLMAGGGATIGGLAIFILAGRRRGRRP